jgi:FtsH-binding integral membrane protein
LGVGLGNDYRGATLLRQRESVGDLRFARFIHNAYLYIAAKMGGFAILVFGWLCIAFLIGGWRVYRKAQPGIWQPIILAMLVSFAGILFWSNTQPNFMVVEGTLFIGVLMGLVAAGRQLGLNEERVL